MKLKTMHDDISNVQELRARYASASKRLWNGAVTHQSQPQVCEDPADPNATVEQCVAIIVERIAHYGEAIRVRSLVQIVATVFGTYASDLLSKSKKARVVLPRQIAMTLIVEIFGLSYSKTGYYVGGHDHATVLHAHHKHKDLVRKLRGNGL